MNIDGETWMEAYRERTFALSRLASAVERIADAFSGPMPSARPTDPDVNGVTVVED
jgi:hypothetical protein